MGVPTGSTYLEAADLEKFVTQLWDGAPGPTVIKSHELGPIALGAVRSGEAKAICTYRDPRDCVASDIAFMNRGLEASIGRVNLTLEYLHAFQATPNILLVRYEDMIADRRRQIRRMGAHLGISVTSSMMNRIDDKTNIQTSRNVCRSLKDRPAGDLIEIASHRVDPQTHLHENHINDAKVGKWKTVFSAGQARWLTEYFGCWLLKLGYETPASLAAFVRSGQVDLVPAITSPVFNEHSGAVAGRR